MEIPLFGVVEQPLQYALILFSLWKVTHKEQNRLNTKSAMILFSHVAVLPQRMLKCSSVLLNKVRARDRRY